MSVSIPERRGYEVPIWGTLDSSYSTTAHARFEALFLALFGLVRYPVFGMVAGLATHPRA